MSALAFSTRPRPRTALVCFGFAEERIRRQPWHVAHGLAEGLARNGHEVRLFTDDAGPAPEGVYAVVRTARLFRRGRPTAELLESVRRLAPERIFLITGAAALARAGRAEWPAPLSLVMASPRLRLREVLAVGPSALWAERRLLALPLINALLPGWLLRRGFVRLAADEIVYLSEAARDRYGALGLPRGRRLRPQVRPFPATSPGHVPLVVYLGPPLALRGAFLAVACFERAREAGTQARLLLLLRPDADPSRLNRRVARSPWRSEIEIESRMLDAAALAARVAPASVFLLPFRAPVSEVPLVVLEAGASGRPVVVLEAPGVSEFARASGGIVARRPADLPKALAEALARPQRPPTGAAGWAGWERAVADLLAQPRLDLADYRFIGLCGVDGSGKTFLLRRLASELEARAIPYRHVWSRFRNYLSKPLLAVARLTGHNRKETVQGVRIGYHDFAGVAWLAYPFLVLQIIDNVIDIVLRYRLRRGRLIIGDRSIFDTLVDLCVDTGLDDLLIDRLGPQLVRLLPRPRLVVVVARPPHLVRETRPDALLDRHFARRQALYRRLAPSFGLPIIENVDSAEAAIATIIDLAQRTGHDCRNPSDDLRLLQQ